jgi:hypothetical protein
MPKKIFNPEVRGNMLQLFREWYEFLGERPIKRAWLYTSHDDLFMRAVNPEFVSEVPKLMGKYFGRGSCFYDYNGVDDLWHYYYACYAAHKSQWNPDWDVDKGLDPHWEKFYGKKAGVKIKEFHRILKESYIKYFSSTKPQIGFENTTLYPAEVYDKLEQLLAEAEKAVTPGSVEEKRLNLFKDPWPKAISKKRKLIEAESFLANVNPEFLEPFQRIDSTGDIFTKFTVNPRPYNGIRARISMYTGTEKARYSFTIESQLPKKDKPSTNSFKQNAGKGKCGFCALTKFLAVTVDGISNEKIEILPSDIKPWGDGKNRGYDVAMNFKGRIFNLRVFMTPLSKLLFFELSQTGGIKAEKVSVEINAIPSHLDTPGGKSRFFGYNREILTARGLFKKPDKKTKRQDVSKDDKYYIFRDADYDGSDKTKGMGPCLFAPSFDAVKGGKINVSDFWTSKVQLDVDPEKPFRFAIFENSDIRTDNEEFKKIISSENLCFPEKLFKPFQTEKSSACSRH